MTVTTDLAAPEQPSAQPPVPVRLDIGAAIGDGWRMFRRRAGTFVLLALLVVVVVAALSVAATMLADELESPIVGAVIGFGAWVGALLVGLGWLRVGLVVARGGTPSVGDLFNLRGYTTYLWASVLVIAVVSVGTALFVIPGLIAATCFCFYGLVIVERGDIGVFESLDWSLAITRGNRWRVLGLITLLTAINVAGLALAGIGVLFTMGITVLAFARAYTVLSEASEQDLAPAATIARDIGERRGVRLVAITLAVAAIGFYLPQWAWDWEVPGGTVVYGAILGSLTALMAFGLVLVYKANRVINFAQADLGAVPASFMISLIALEGWPFWYALVVSLIAAVALGSAIEFVIVRRFSRAPRLILMVVTVGIAQLLAGFGVALQFFMGAELPVQTLAPPFDFSFEITPQIFHAPELVAVVSTVLAVGGLWAFLRFTSIGIALRASSESSDRASMLGVNVGLTHNIAWILATVLATLSLILRAGIIGLPLGPAFGPSVLLVALTAAVIGKMENFVAIFLASCGLGAVEQIVLWNTGSSELIAPILFVIVIVALLLQRRNKESRVEDQAISSWQNAANVRPIPRELLALPEVKWTLRAMRLLFVGFLILLPFLLSEKDTNLAAAVLIYAMIAISLVLLTGWAGEISLGQIAFVAIGSAAAGAANVHWQLDPLLSFVLAGAVGAVVSVVIGLPALRIRGLFLAVTTLAFAVMTSSFLLNRDQSVLGIKFDYLPVRARPSGPVPAVDALRSRGYRRFRAPHRAVVLLHVRVLPAARHGRSARLAAVAHRARPRRAARERAQRAGLPPEPDDDQTPGLRAVRIHRVVRGRRAGPALPSARPGRVRAGGEHPRAHDGRGRRPRFGPRRDPRCGVHQEHRVVQRHRPVALPVPVHLRRQRRRSHRRAVAVARRTRFGPLPSSRRMVAAGGAPAGHRRPVTHRRLR